METTSSASTSISRPTIRNTSLDIRLKSIRRVIRDATAAALKNVETYQTDTSMTESPFAGIAEPSSGTHGASEAQEFDLAMTLFGDDPRSIEEDISSRLCKVEEELHDYFARKEEERDQEMLEPDSSSNILISGNDKSGIDYESFGITETSDPQLKRRVLEDEARQLKIKISFLKKCSEARVALNDAASCLLEASCGSRRAVMVSTAQHLSKAKKVLVDAEKCVMAQQQQRHGQGQQLNTSDAKVANDILQSIHSQITRKTVELHARATSILNSFITITPNSISVCEGPAKPELTIPVALNDSTNSLSAPAAVLSQEDTYEGLKVAIEVLTILSEKTSTSSSSYSRLEVAMKVVANELLTVVLRPVIEAARERLDKGEKPAIFTFHESTAKSSAGFGGLSKMSSTASGSGVKVKGMVTTLEWSETEKDGKDETAAMEMDTSTPENTLDWWPNLLQFIKRLMKFVCEKVLNQGEGDSLYAMFGRAVFGQTATSNPYSLPFDADIMEHGEKCPIIKLLCRLLWEHCIPDSSTPKDLARLVKVSTELIESTNSFESFLLESHLIEKNTALAGYANGFLDKYNDKVRTSILGRGRKILLEGDYHNSVKVGINVYEKKKARRPEYLDFIDMEQDDLSIFLLEECGISEVAFNLMKLCKETMELAVDKSTVSHALLSPTLYRSSRELLDLFRATIPAVHGSEIATIPRTAAIFHNDCVFFAHKMLSFGLEYRDRLPPDENGKESSFKKMCTFLDLVPIFREMANRSMNDMIQFQKIQVSEIVTPRLPYLSDALGANEGVVEWTDAETGLTAGLYHLRHLSHAWKSMLAHDVYCITMGSIVDALLKLYLDKVLNAKDVSVPACHFVSALFRNALRGVTELFGSQAISGEGDKEAGKFCALHHKFTAVGRFMDMTLADINMALSEGLFKSVTGAELSKLVCAVFEDKEPRRKMLRLLESN